MINGRKQIDFLIFPSLSGKLTNIDWNAPTPIDSDKKAAILAALKVDAA